MCAIMDRKKRAMWLAALDAAGVLGGGAEFNPATNLTNPVTNYDASDTSTIFQDSAATAPAGVGDPVGYLGDKIGTNHLTQGTTSRKPTRNAQSITFDGTDDFLSNSTLGLSNPVTVYLVVRYVTISANAFVFDHVSGVGERLLAFNNSGTLSFGPSGIDTIATPTVTKVFALVSNGASSAVYVNTSDTFTGSLSTTGMGSLTLGADLIENRAGNIEFNQMIIQNAVPSEDERNACINYLISKWGVTV